MEASLLSILALGFVLGIKHAIEPDHVIAVSTIASRSKQLWRSSLAGVFWGIGHTATLFVVGTALILMKDEIPDKWAMSLEFLVGIMLVYLGVTTFTSLSRLRLRRHEHEGSVHKHVLAAGPGGSEPHRHTGFSYWKSLAIGFIHGLAGSGAMVLLTMSTVNGVGQGIVYILIFGAGTVVGMLLFTTLLGIPFVLSSGRLTLNAMLTRATGVISVGFGLYYMYNLGVNEGLFQLWFS
ncbi:sulfite exporter TauE/SafE family protein [Paenibacillus sp. J31TS4]|uniref:HoxN/HupN/NixA family nickel/cobalt transporter n=1 Tax=Paenibacillus sp. J31TS4 TaxID=2807195 RepID=UPI001BCD9BB5|nr:sulfite exporter TauE/SafE family protein [Paenibacillus sp. J31TS4]